MRGAIDIMWKKRALLLVAGVAVLAVCVLAGLRLARPAACDSPLVVSNYFAPDRVLLYFVQERGGLPRSDTEVTAALDPSAGVETYPIRDWSVERISVSSPFPLWQSVVDDDPTYMITVDTRVRYSDGGEAVLRWSSWRPGVAICPIVLDRGDGPPGAIELIRLTGGG